MTVELVSDFVVPSIERQLVQTYAVAKDARSDTLVGTLGHRIAGLERSLHEVLSYSEALKQSLSAINGLEDEAQKVDTLVRDAKPLGAKLRAAADRAEQEVGEEFWTLPKYRDLLFHESMR